MIVWLYKGFKVFYAKVFSHITSILTRLCFRLNGIQFLGKVRSSGVPVIHMSLNSVCVIGKNFSMGNWVVNNASGVKAKSKIEVRRGAELIIGENVGITSVTIMCFDKIHIARQIMAIRVSTNINLKYIKLFLESMISEIKKSANGLIPGISRDDILSLNISLPPLAEQRRIVQAIETAFAQLDRSLAVRRRYIRVVSMLSCPIKSASKAISLYFSRKFLAYLCRKEWG